MKQATPSLPPPPGPVAPTPLAYYQIAAQRVEHTFQPPKGYKLKKRRRWPWVVVAILVIGGIVSAVAKPKADTPASTPSAGGAAAQTAALTVGLTGTTSGLDVTLIAFTDPWVSTNQFEQPAAGNRYVAVELNIVNTTGDTQTFSTLLGLEVIDSLGQHWNPTLAGANLPRLDGTLPPGQAIRGTQVFEVPTTSTGLTLSVKGSLTASGITFTL